VAFGPPSSKDNYKLYIIVQRNFFTVYLSPFLSLFYSAPISRIHVGRISIKMTHFDELALTNFGDVRYIEITDKLSASTESVPNLHIKGVEQKDLYQNTVTFSAMAIKRANKDADIQSVTGSICQSGVAITNITSVQQNGNKYEITVTNKQQRDQLIDGGFKMGGLNINCTT